MACSCKKGAGEMSPGLLLPACHLCCSLELWRQPQEVLLTVQMQTGEVPVQPYGACGAWANTGDSHLWAPTTSGQELTGPALAHVMCSAIYTPLTPSAVV